jgi:hypothetical protein
VGADRVQRNALTAFIQVAKIGLGLGVTLLGCAAHPVGGLFRLQGRAAERGGTLSNGGTVAGSLSYTLKPGNFLNVQFDGTNLM